MHGFRRLALCALLCSSACTSAPAQPAKPPTWSDSDPVVQPARPVERNVGRVVIHTPRAESVTLKGDTYSGVHFRGYKVYDDRGNLVKDCPGHSDQDDALTLEAGRYIVFAVLERSLLDEKAQTIQFVVAKGETTYVDMTKPPAPTR